MNRREAIKTLLGFGAATAVPQIVAAPAPQEVKVVEKVKFITLGNTLPDRVNVRDESISAIEMERYFAAKDKRRELVNDSSEWKAMKKALRPIRQFTKRRKVK